MKSMFPLITRFDNLFDTFLDTYDNTRRNSMVDNKVISVGLPGYSKNDIEVTFDEDMRQLRITGELKEEKKKYYSCENISKAWYIPKNLSVGEINLEDGLLLIKLEDNTPPKKEPLKLPVK